MTDITPAFNTLLKSSGSQQIIPRKYSIDRLDDFLKEAYRINSLISDLTHRLISTRSSYLSFTSSLPSSSSSSSSTTLTDRQRNQIDLETKSLLTALSSALTSLSSAETIRRETLLALLRKKTHGGGGLGRALRWAGGDVSPPDDMQDDAEKLKQTFRDGVLWFLKKGLERVGSLQRNMVMARLKREEERGRSLLFASNNTTSTDIPRKTTGQTNAGVRNVMDVQREEEDVKLSEEQIQLFAEENKGMLKHLGQQLDQVRAVHQSLEEISELQTSLAMNLESQNAQIDQLVQDSLSTEENVGKGNKELKKASEKTSTARILFHSTCAFCTFLVVWDLVF